MLCDPTNGGCGNEAAYHLKRGYYKDDTGTSLSYEYCDRCGSAPSVYVPDVYFKSGEVVESLGGMVFGSKRHKAAYLRAKGYAEAGDRTGGADPLDFPTTKPKTTYAEARAAAKEAVAQARRKLLYKNDR